LPSLANFSKSELESQLMVANVREGEEQMPHRYQLSLPISKADQVPAVLPVAIPTSAMLILSKDE